MGVNIGRPGRFVEMEIEFFKVVDSFFSFFFSTTDGDWWLRSSLSDEFY